MPHTKWRQLILLELSALNHWLWGILKNTFHSLFIFYALYFINQLVLPWIFKFDQWYSSVSPTKKSGFKCPSWLIINSKNKNKNFEFAYIYFFINHLLLPWIFKFTHMLCLASIGFFFFWIHICWWNYVFFGLCGSTIMSIIWHG